MGEMAIDRGSELHMLRFLGRHRRMLDEAVGKRISQDCGEQMLEMEWLDFHFDPKNRQKDGEWKSVDFLSDAGGADWLNYWPDPSPGRLNRKGMPSWDAVAKVKVSGKFEWLLVEAKAHLRELRSPSARCRAGGANLEKIKRALCAAYEFNTPRNRRPWQDVEAVWLGRDYQKANRLACLHFLNRLTPTARLLYVYFTGDKFSDSPSNTTGWREEIEAQYQALGLSRGKLDRVHELFLNVASAKAGA